MSKFAQIAAFITVVEENSFTAAAKKQGLSKAAISRQIAHLEKNIGAQLLRRTTRHLVLTEIGKQYYRFCKDALYTFSEAERAIASSKDEATGVLHVMANRYFIEQHLLLRLPEFMALNPKLQIRFELAERFPDLTKENIDVIFGVSILGPAELVQRCFTTTRYVLCAAPAYLAKYGMPQTPADLMQHHYITHSMRENNKVVRFKEDKEIYVEPILWLNDSGAMRECALKGLGVVELHDYIIADEIRDGRLIELLPEFSKPSQPVFLYYQQSRYLQPKIRRFIDFYTS